MPTPDLTALLADAVEVSALFTSAIGIVLAVTIGPRFVKKFVGMLKGK